MSFDPRMQDSAASYGTATQVDVGLQTHMKSVFNTMGLGLLTTGLVAWLAVAIEPIRAIVLSPLYLLFVLAPLGFLLFGFTPNKIAVWPAAKLRSTFYIYSGVMGLSMCALFAIYPAVSIARVFFITAAMFAGSALYGYSTKKDLTSFGSFMMMGLMGMVFAGLINLFFHSGMMQFVLSWVGVIVFTGLAAWDTQYIKESYAYGAGATEANEKMATLGALRMYMNFINLFQNLLYLMGNNRQ